MYESASAIIDRKKQLKKVSESYFEALRNKDFSSIPFSNEVVLRAPFAPGGVHLPLMGKPAVFEQWWKPLEPALSGVTITIADNYYNDSLTGIITKAEISLAGLGITLRVADQFIIDEQGMIRNDFAHTPDAKEIFEGAGLHTLIDGLLKPAAVGTKNSTTKK